MKDGKRKRPYGTDAARRRKAAGGGRSRGGGRAKPGRADPGANSGGSARGRPTAETILSELGEFAESFLEHTGIEMDRKLKDDLARYVLELYKWNDRAALLSKKDEERVVERHVMDSLSLLAFFHEAEGATVLDIGSGAGFPAIPVKLAARGLVVALVESVRKKTLFLNAVCERLGLSDTFVFCDRAENSPWRKLAPEGFDVVTSRATFSLAELIPLAVPAVKRGGLLIAYKGGRYEDELKAASSAMARTSLRLITAWQSPWGPGRLVAFQRG